MLTGCGVEKEGIKTTKVQISIRHQDETGRASTRSGNRNINLTQGVRTEFVLALPADDALTKNYRVLDPQDSALTQLSDSTVSLNLPLKTPLRLAVFRFRTAYTAAQLKAQLRSFDSYGFSAPFTLSANQTELTVEIPIRPNGTPAVRVGTLAGTVSESGGQATFTVSLATAPKEDVQIPVTVSDTSEGRVAPASLTFTPLDWMTAQTVTVTGLDDSVDDGDVTWAVRLGAVTSLDTDYNGMDPDDVAVITTDDDTAGITVAVTDNASSESGGTASLTVRLDSQPTDNVTLPVSSSDNASGRTSVSSLSFTVSNWNTPQTVTVTGQPNNAVNSSTYQVSFGASSSTDRKYQGLTPASVGLTNTDDLGPAVSSVTPADNSTSVALNTSLSVTFSESLKASSVFTSSNTAACAGLTSTVLLSSDNFSTCLGLGTPAWSGTQQFSVVPTSPGLAYDQTYQFRIKGGSGGVNDTAGNVLAADHTTSFSTPVRPRLTSTAPDNNSTAVSRYSTLSLTFSKDMNPQTFAGITSSPSMSGSFAYDNATRTIRFTPSGPLADNTTYIVSLPDNVTDTSGIPLVPTTLRFATTNLGSGLVAHYTLDNNTLDHSKLDGGFQDSALPGGTSNPSSTTGRDNTSNGAYEFTPSSTTSGDYLSVAHNAALAPTSAITVSLWAYSSNWQTLCNGTSPRLLSKTQSGGYNIGCHQDTIRFILHIGGSYQQRTHPVSGLVSGWHHFVGTYASNTGKQFLYIDGVAMDNATVSGSITYRDDNALVIGGEAGSGSSPDAEGGDYPFFTGKLDDIRIYNRTLAANEVFDLYFEPARRLAAYYPLAGNGNDLSGNAYHGTLGSGSSAPSVTTGHTGSNAQAYSFDGTDDYIALNKFVSPNSISSTTVCVWAKSTDQSKDKFLISFDRSESWRLALNDDQVGDNVGWDTTQYGGTTNDLNTSQSYDDGQWHHICGWYEAGKAPDKKIYVDGTLVKSATAHGGSNLGTSDRAKHYGYIGWGSKSGSFNGQATSTHSGDFMQGSIDDVRIYDRALSDKEISALYSVADKHPPLPGNSGTVTASSVTSTGLTLTWTTASDDFTDNASLQYKVVRADSNRIGTPETAGRNGTLVQDWTANLSTASVSGLTASTTYHFSVLVRDNVSNTTSYQPLSQATSAANSTEVVSPTAVNWGNNANYQNVYVYTVDKGTNTLGTVNDYSSFCTSKGKNYISSAGYPAGGNSYSSSNTSNALYVAAKNYFENTVKPTMPAITHDNLLVLHGNSANCFAHNANAGSMHAFGGPTGTGYAFCRSGASASKRFHMYICK